MTQTRLDAETKLIDNLSTPDGLGEAEWALMNKESKLKYINENPDKYPNDDVSLLETYTNAVEAEQEASNPGIVDGLGNIIENGIDRLDNGLQTANEAIFGNEEEDKKGVLGHGEEFLFGDSEKADRLDNAQDDFFNFTPKTETEDVADGEGNDAWSSIAQSTREKLPDDPAFDDWNSMSNEEKLKVLQDNPGATFPTTAEGDDTVNIEDIWKNLQDDKEY